MDPCRGDEEHDGLSLFKESRSVADLDLFFARCLDGLVNQEESNQRELLIGLHLPPFAVVIMKASWKHQIAITFVFWLVITHN